MVTAGLTDLDQFALAPVEQMIGSGDLPWRQGRLPLQPDRKRPVAEPEVGDERHVPIDERIVEKDDRAAGPDARAQQSKLLDHIPRKSARLRHRRLDERSL